MSEQDLQDAVRKVLGEECSDAMDKARFTLPVRMRMCAESHFIDLVLRDDVTVEDVQIAKALEQLNEDGFLDLEKIGH